MNNCSCQVCNNTVSFVPDLKNGASLPAQQAPEKVVLSVHDRLEALEEYLSLHRIPEKYMDELRSIMEAVNEVDNEIIKLKGSNLAFPVEVELGEISKKLY